MRAPARLLVNAAVLDPAGDAFLDDAGLWVESGRIRAAGPVEDVRAQVREAHADAAIVDLDGAFVLPGLVNLHVHLGLTFPGAPPESLPAHVLRMAAAAKATLETGVTCVRLVGERGGCDFALRAAIDRGQAPGPRIFAAGEILYSSFGANEMTRAIGLSDDRLGYSGADAFMRAAREQMSSGADLVKIYASSSISIGPRDHLEDALMTPDEMQAVARAAHDRGRKVAAHAGPSHVVINAVEAGIDSIEHGYLLDAEAAASMARRGAWLVPTLCVTRCEGFYRRIGVPAPLIDRAMTWGEGHRAGFQAALAADVRIGLGTDMLPFEEFDGTNATVREMELMAEAGMPAAAVIRSGTAGAAELLGVATEIGTLENGKAADLIALSANPLEDISAMRSVHFVMKDGAVAFDGRKDTK